MPDETLFPLDSVPAADDGFPKLPGRRVMERLWKQVDNLLDLCDHPFDMPTDGTVHMTSTRGFFDLLPDGKPRAVGLAVLTCPDCRPLIEKVIDEACGGHDDEPWPRKAS